MSSTDPVNVRLHNDVVTDDAPRPLPVFSQAIKTENLIYVSGNIGMDPRTYELVPGGIKAQTVSLPHVYHLALKSLLTQSLPHTDSDPEEFQSGPRSRRFGAGESGQGQRVYH